MRVSKRMRKAIRAIPVLIGVFLALLFTGCEQLFTSSLFSSFQRNPSELSYEQQVTYGEEALASGDQETMKDAYEALAESIENTSEPDPDVLELAGDLAVGASGLNDVLPKLVGAVETDSFSSTEDLESIFEDSLDDVDYQYIDEAEDQLTAATKAGADISEEQYLTVAAGLAMKAEDDGTGMENSTELEDFVDTAVSAMGPDYDGPLKDLQGAL